MRVPRTKLPKRPYIELAALPPPEFRDADYLNRLTWGFWEYLHRFDDAFQLCYHHATRAFKALDKGSTRAAKRAVKGDVEALWRETKADERFSYHARMNAVALRDACMSAFHGAKTVAAINRAARTATDETKSRINFDLLNQTAPLFDAYFPNIHRIRHAISHAGETTADRANMHDSWEVNLLRTPEFSGFAWGNALTLMFEGQRLRWSCPDWWCTSRRAS
jgi:hypothetical protein